MRQTDFVVGFISVLLAIAGLLFFAVYIWRGKK